MGIVIRQTIKGTIVNYVGTVVGFVTTFFVLVRFLTAEEIGLTRVLVDAAMLFVALAQLGTSSSVIRYFPYFHTSKDDKDHGFFFWTIVIPFLGFLIFSVFYILLSRFLLRISLQKNRPCLLSTITWCFLLHFSCFIRLFLR